MNNIVGAILAGGKSSRMGFDKSTLELNGTTLLDRSELILKTTSIDNIYISRKNYISDKIPECGALSGIHSILNEVLKDNKVNHILFIPIDMPALTSSLLQKLISAPTDIPLVYFKSFKLPFRISADKKWLELSEKLLQNHNDFSIGNFQKNINNYLNIEVNSNEKHCFNNINTYTQWKNYLNKT